MYLCCAPNQLVMFDPPRQSPAMSKRNSRKEKKQRREKREARKREQRKKTGRSWVRTAWPFLGRSHKTKSHSAMPMALVLDSGDLWDEKPTWEGVRERLATYSL